MELGVHHRGERDHNSEMSRPRVVNVVQTAESSARRGMFALNHRLRRPRIGERLGNRHGEQRNAHAADRRRSENPANRQKFIATSPEPELCNRTHVAALAPKLPAIENAGSLIAREAISPRIGAPFNGRAERFQARLRTPPAHNLLGCTSKLAKFFHRTLCTTIPRENRLQPPSARPVRPRPAAPRTLNHKAGQISASTDSGGANVASAGACEEALGYFFLQRKWLPTQWNKTTS